MKSKFHHIIALCGIAILGHLIAFEFFHIPNQLGLVLIIGLVLIYPIIRIPVVGVYAVFLLLPFVTYVRRLYYLMYARPSADPLLMTGEIILVLIFIALFFEFSERRKNSSRQSFANLLVWFYFAYMLIRVPLLNELPLAEAAAQFKFYGPTVLFFFVGTIFSRHIRSLKTIWVITIIVSVIAAVYGLRQLMVGFSEAELVWLASIEFSTLFIKNVIRPFSFFQSPVAFADYLQLGIIGILMCMSWFKKSFAFVLLGLVPLLFYAVLVTSVRSSWIAVITTFLFWFTLVNVKTTRQRVVMVGVVLLGYMLVTLGGEMIMNGGIDTVINVVGGKLGNKESMDLLVTNRTTALTSPLEEHSFVSRVALWKNLLVWSSNPELAIMGRGLGALKADSLYFTYLAEFGYPGVILIIIVLITFVMAGFSLIDSTKDPAITVLAKGITVMNIVFAFVSITGSHIHYFPGDVYFWFWNGVLTALAFAERNKVRDAQQSQNLELTSHETPVNA